MTVLANVVFSNFLLFAKEKIKATLSYEEVYDEAIKILIDYEEVQKFKEVKMRQEDYIYEEAEKIFEEKELTYDVEKDGPLIIEGIIQDLYNKKEELEDAVQNKSETLTGKDKEFYDTLQYLKEHNATPSKAKKKKKSNDIKIEKIVDSIEKIVDSYEDELIQSIIEKETLSTEEESIKLKEFAERDEEIIKMFVREYAEIVNSQKTNNLDSFAKKELQSLLDKTERLRKLLKKKYNKD